MKWLQQRQISGLAIFYFISIADSSSILKVIGDENHIGKIVTFAENIPHFILQKNKQIEQYYKPNRQLKNKIITAIMKEHNDQNIDMIKKFNINMEDILPGVICRKCYLLKTSYHFGYWTCSNCGHKDKEGYIHGLRDYFTLFGNGISNKSARNFLEMPYKSTMTRMLKRANLNYKKADRKWYHN